MFHIAKSGPTPYIVFEGNADACNHFHGITNAVAICGLSLNEASSKYVLENGIYDIVVCLDMLMKLWTN